MGTTADLISPEFDTSQNKQAHGHTCTPHTQTHTHLYADRLIHNTCTHSSTHTHTHTHTHMHTHTHTNTHTHTYTQRHTHTHAQAHT